MHTQSQFEAGISLKYYGIMEYYGILYLILNTLLWNTSEPRYLANIGPDRVMNSLQIRISKTSVAL